MDENINKTLYKLCLKAYKKNEVPVSAVILRNGKIIAKAYNKKNINNNSLFHAEILCLQKASKKLKRWNLSDCTMYVTLEPCSMCKMVINESRISSVYYILNKLSYNQNVNNTKYEQVYVRNSNKFSRLLKNFFKIRRK